MAEDFIGADELERRRKASGYCIEVARREGWDEVEVVNALLKLALLGGRWPHWATP
jgi:hypothetical protein